MPLQIALIRGINVGGNKMIAMADLRDTFERLGFTDVKTLLNSGNVVFRSTKKTDAIERALEKEIDAVCFVRTAEEWTRIIERNPFPAEAKSDPGHLLVTVFKEDPRGDLEAAIKGRERIHLDGRVLYAFYPDGAGRSKLTNSLIEKELGTRGTARNWNTVLKVHAAVMER